MFNAMEREKPDQKNWTLSEVSASPTVSQANAIPTITPRIPKTRPKSTTLAGSAAMDMRTGVPVILRSQKTGNRVGVKQ
ncbi:MAG: hypothetical protein ACFFCW_41025 [Candidatus Hodarchaeota archaeon]